MRRIDDATRARILANLRASVSSYRAVLKHSVSQSTVSRLARTLPENVQADLRSKGGRPARITPTTKRLMVRRITNGELDNAVQVQKYLNDELNIKLSVNRVREILREEGLTAVHKKKKPKLTEKHRRLRREFVEKYRHWTVDDWKRVLWTDETKINRHGSDGTLWTWKNTRVGDQARLVEETLKHGGGSIVIWGCMHWEGVGYISRIEGGLDAKLYIEILDECIPLMLDWYNIDLEELIFQQDNDPKHIAKITTEYLKEKGFTILFWPPNSPDLNPIEHLWAHLKRQLAKYPRSPTSIKDFWERVQQTWNNIDTKVCQDLISSMPRRVETVRKARGRYTKY